MLSGLARCFNKHFVPLNYVMLLLLMAHMYKHTDADKHTHTHRNHYKWLPAVLQRKPLPLTSYHCIKHPPPPLFTPVLFPFALILSSQPLNNLHPEVEKRLDNKSGLKGHTPTVFTLAGPEQQWKWTAKRPVVLRADQVSVWTFISGCHSQDDLRTLRG